MPSGLGSGPCALAGTREWQEEGPSHRAAGGWRGKGKGVLPFDLEPRVPHGWLHGLLWLPGTTGISSIPSPSSSCSNHPGQEASQSDLDGSSCVLRRWTSHIPWGWS